MREDIQKIINLVRGVSEEIKADGMNKDLFEILNEAIVRLAELNGRLREHEESKNRTIDEIMESVKRILENQQI